MSGILVYQSFSIGSLLVLYWFSIGCLLQEPARSYAKRILFFNIDWNTFIITA